MLSGQNENEAAFIGSSSLSVLVRNSKSPKSTENARENWLAPVNFALRVVSWGSSPNSGVFSERYGFKTVFDSTQSDADPD